MFPVFLLIQPNKSFTVLVVKKVVTLSSTPNTAITCHFLKVCKSLLNTTGINLKQKEQKMNHENEKIKQLNKIAVTYHGAFLNYEKAQMYLRQRGISKPEIIKKYKIGYCTGDVINRLIDTSQEYKILKEIGIFKEREAGNKYEYFKGYLTFPFFDEHGNVGEIYARNITGNTKLIHKYLPGKHKGLLNGPGIETFSELYLCECVIDALSLIQMGIYNVTCTFGKGNLTDELIKKIVTKTKKLYICYDNDGDDDKTAKETAEIFKKYQLPVVRHCLPAEYKDINDYLVMGLEQEKTREQLREQFVNYPKKSYFDFVKKRRKHNTIEKEIRYRNGSPSFTLCHLRIKRKN
jgi:DNA primase